MTDRAAIPPNARLSPKGQADLPNWDPLLRLTHWGVAAVVIGNSFFTKEGGSIHVALGWVGMALLVLRLIWGVIGPDEARFSSFPPRPIAALRHLAGLMRGKADVYPSHNPAGALMAYALWANLAVIVATGLGMNGLSPLRQAEVEAAVAAGDWSVVVEEEDSPFGEALEEVHEVAANLIQFLAVLHVAGVMIEGRVMRRNLVAPMLIARKGRRR